MLITISAILSAEPKLSAPAMWYFLLRYGLIPIALLAWVGNQLIFKKKRFKEMQADLLAALFLAVVYLFFFYLIFS